MIARGLEMEFFKMKKLLFSASAMLVGLPLLAEETSGGSTSGINLAPATDALSDVSDALVSWAGAAMEPLLAIAGAFLVFWLGRMVFRLVKGWTNSAK